MTNFDLHGTTYRTVATTLGAIHDLVRRLDVRVTDRSARDFAIMCELLRRGLLESDIYALVIDRSKFGTNGGDYFRHTFENARRATGDELS